MIRAELLERARSVRLEDEVPRRGISVKGRTERVGPCPKCGGRDRFSIEVANRRISALYDGLMA
jgi:hypothetical protein